MKLTLLTLLIYSGSCYAQNLTQNLRGKVIEEELETTLIGAHVMAIGVQDTLNTRTDLDGKFFFNQIPIGRYTVVVKIPGYEIKQVPNLLLNAGKEMVLEIRMTELISSMKTLEIVGNTDKSSAQNEMATVSARSFSIEETSRYAGSFNDPGRMAQSFAGVASNDDESNEIVIRGNSPRGVLWKMEGIEIPNPNHFSGVGSSGGSISMLNSSVIGNSDFFTGAFPAEYGNAASGVFDINLRNGNDSKREYSLQFGLLGAEASLEGPFSKGNASYLVNYRYSSIALLNYIGIDIVGDAVPVFQDLSYNVYLPTKNAGTFSLFGLGGISAIEEDYDDYKGDFTQYLAVSGVTHSMLLGDKTVLKSVFAYTLTSMQNEDQELDSNNVFYDDYKERYDNSTYRLSSTLTHRFNSKNTFKAGVIYGILGYDVNFSSFDLENQQRVTGLDSKGTTGLLQSFVSHKYRITENLNLNGGLHHTYFVLNGSSQLEPRLGLNWNFRKNQSLSAGFGVHSRLEHLTMYFGQTEDANGNPIHPNKNLGLSQSYHYVLGYDLIPKKDWHVRTEVYYQNLKNVPIVDDPNTSQSILNYTEGWTTTPLVNKGTGENFGAEITIEKFFSDSWYFMITASLYNSTYTAADGVRRNTRFNGNYANNYTFGKEFMVGKNKNNILAFSTRVNWAGGRRVTPILLDESIAAGYTVRDENRLYEEKTDDYFRIDFQASFRTNKKNTTRVVKLDIQNVTNRANIWNEFYNPTTQSIMKSTQMGLLPVLSYQFIF